MGRYGGLLTGKVRPRCSPRAGAPTRCAKAPDRFRATWVCLCLKVLKGAIGYLVSGNNHGYIPLIMVNYESPKWGITRLANHLLSTVPL